MRVVLLLDNVCMQGKKAGASNAMAAASNCPCSVWSLLHKCPCTSETCACDKAAAYRTERVVPHVGHLEDRLSHGAAPPG